MTLPIAIADWSQTTGGGAISITILFQGDESTPEKPRAHGRWNTPLEGISYECLSARAPLPGTKAALTSKVSMARGCLALLASNWNTHMKCS